MSQTLPELFEPWAGRSVLVTGAFGFVGTHVVDVGRGLGVKLTGFGRTANPFIENCLGDLTDPARVQEVVAQVAPEAILHLGAAGVSYGGNDFAMMLAVNVRGTANLLNAASELPKAPIVICAGSGFEYAPSCHPRRESEALAPHGWYGASKAAATAVVSSHAARMSMTVLRPFSIYGQGEPLPRFAAYIVGQAIAGKPVELTAGEQMRDYTDVGDVAEAFWRALALAPPPGRMRVLNIGTGQEVRLRDFAEGLARRLDTRGIVAKLRFGKRPYRSDEMMHYAPDVGLLRETLGWVPGTSLEKGIGRFVDDAMLAMLDRL